MESELKGIGIDVGTYWIYAVYLMFTALLFLRQLSSQSSHPSDADQRVQNCVESIFLNCPGFTIPCLMQIHRITLAFRSCSATASIMSDSAFKDGSGKYIFRGNVHTALVSFASIRCFPCNGLNGDEYR